MIHDAKVEVTCDNDGCPGNVSIELDPDYRNVAGHCEHYDSINDEIEEKLVKDHGWVVRNETHHGWIVRDGRHFCNPGCS